MTDPEPATPGTAEEQPAEPHDPGPPEQYAGAPVPDPWEEVRDGLDPDSEPGQPAD